MQRGRENSVPWLVAVANREVVPKAKTLTNAALAPNFELFYALNWLRIQSKGTLQRVKSETLAQAYSLKFLFVYT